MLKLRRIKLLFIIFLLFFGFGVFSYDNLVIHPSLSRGAAEIYNNQTEKKLTDEQINWIVEGSIAEDTDPRYLNHYYDPTTGLGLHGWDTLYGKQIKVSGLPAKTWAKNQSSASGDYSESAIFNNYKSGDYKRAYQGVGHILHLIQDMAVPAHTRNDSHAMGDPYEKWAQQYGHVNLSRANYIYVNNLDQPFDELANYSNAGFFSKDTVIKDFLFDSSKIEKDLEGEDSNYLYLNGHKIIKVKEYYWGNEYLFDFKVHLDYWNMLYPKAVGYSAGVIDYFIREFEKINEQKAKEQADLSFWDTLNNLWDSVRYVWGDTFIASRMTVGDVWGLTKETAKTTQAGAKYFTQANMEILEDTAGRVLSAAEGLSLQDVLGVKVADTAESGELNSGQEEEYRDREFSSEASEISSGGVGVERVIDGDTIVLTSGEKVRYIGIDTPELNGPGSDDDECLAWLARLRNMELLSRGELELVKDPGADKDKYGRLLRYVYVNGIFVNEVLAREGLAETFFCPAEAGENCPVTADSDRENLILSAGQEAQENERGIYSDVCQEKGDKEDREDIEDREGAESRELSSGYPELSSDEELSSNDKEDWLVIFGAKGNPEEEFLDSEDEQDQIDEITEEEPEIVPVIIIFNLASLTSSSTAYTAGASVELDYEIQNQDLVEGYYLSENDITPAADDENWATSSPASFVLSGGEGERTVYFWLRYNENQVTDNVSASIALDTTAPEPPSVTSIVPSEDVYWVNGSQVGLVGDKDNLVNKIFINETEYSATTTEEVWQADINIDFTCSQQDAGERMACFMSYCMENPGACGSMDVLDDLYKREVIFQSKDQAGNLSEEEAKDFKLDLYSPKISNLLGFNSLARRKLYVALSSSDTPSGEISLESGIVGHEWQYQLDGSEDWLDAGSLESMVIDGVNVYLFSGESGSSYVFQVRAYDRAGNYGSWSSEIGKTVSVSFPSAYPVISEIYGGGGNSGSYWKNDFIEIYNPNDFAISLDGWSVQYAAATSATTSVSWNVTPLIGNIPAYGYYLVKEHPEGAGTADLPVADAVGEINLSATAGKVALVNNPEAITGKDDENVVDFVGYGGDANEWEADPDWANQRVPALPSSKRNTASIERRAFIDSDASKLSPGGEHETSGNSWDSHRNSEDFVVRDTPEPQNSEVSEVPVD